MKAQTGQNIFDLTAQNFGSLDETVKFAVDNGFSLNQELPLDQDLVIDNPVGTGDDKIKESIKVQGITLNNDKVQFVTLTADTTQYTADTTQLTADRITE